MDLHQLVESIIGPTSGTQSNSVMLAALASQLAQLHGLTGSFQTASLGRDVIESVIGIHLVCIQNSAFHGWGSYSR